MAWLKVVGPHSASPQEAQTDRQQCLLSQVAEM